jgi:hypothetical protein
MHPGLKAWTVTEVLVRGRHFRQGGPGLDRDNVRCRPTSAELWRWI